MGFKKNTGVNMLEEIIETVKEVIPESEVQVIEKTEEPEGPQITNDTKVLPKKKLKRGKYNKKVIRLDVGIIGSTTEIKDFRAIVKKKGEQINIVLNGIIAEWNHRNYNL